MRQQQVKERQWKQKARKMSEYLLPMCNGHGPKQLASRRKKQRFEGGGVAIKCHKNRRVELKFPNCCSMWSAGNGGPFFLVKFSRKSQCPWTEVNGVYVLRLICPPMSIFDGHFCDFIRWKCFAKASYILLRIS